MINLNRVKMATIYILIIIREKLLWAQLKFGELWCVPTVLPSTYDACLLLIVFIVSKVSKVLLIRALANPGLRGAIAYALALNLADQGSKFASREMIGVLSTTTLIIVLFTILVFGGSTLPLLKCLSKGSHGSDLTLSKTEDVGVAPAMSPDQEELPEPITQIKHQWFLMLDYR